MASVQQPTPNGPIGWTHPSKPRTVHPSTPITTPLSTPPIGMGSTPPPTTTTSPPARPATSSTTTVWGGTATVWTPGASSPHPDDSDDAIPTIPAVAPAPPVPGTVLLTGLLLGDRDPLTIPVTPTTPITSLKRAIVKAAAVASPTSLLVFKITDAVMRAKGTEDARLRRAVADCTSRSHLAPSAIVVMAACRPVSGEEGEEEDGGEEDRRGRRRRKGETVGEWFAEAWADEEGRSSRGRDVLHFVAVVDESEGVVETMAAVAGGSGGARVLNGDAYRNMVMMDEPVPAEAPPSYFMNQPGDVTPADATPPIQLPIPAAAAQPPTPPQSVASSVSSKKSAHSAPGSTVTTVAPAPVPAPAPSTPPATAAPPAVAYFATPIAATAVPVPAPQPAPAPIPPKRSQSFSNNALFSIVTASISQPSNAASSNAGTPPLPSAPSHMPTSPAVQAPGTGTLPFALPAPPAKQPPFGSHGNVAHQQQPQQMQQAQLQQYPQHPQQAHHHPQQYPQQQPVQQHQQYPQQHTTHQQQQQPPAHQQQQPLVQQQHQPPVPPRGRSSSQPPISRRRRKSAAPPPEPGTTVATTDRRQRALSPAPPPGPAASTATAYANTGTRNPASGPVPPLRSKSPAPPPRRAKSPAPPPRHPPGTASAPLPVPAALGPPAAAAPGPLGARGLSAAMSFDSAQAWQQHQSMTRSRHLSTMGGDADKALAVDARNWPASAAAPASASAAGGGGGRMRLSMIGLTGGSHAPAENPDDVVIWPTLPGIVPGPGSPTPQSQQQHELMAVPFPSQAPSQPPNLAYHPQQQHPQQQHHQPRVKFAPTTTPSPDRAGGAVRIPTRKEVSIEGAQAYLQQDLQDLQAMARGGSASAAVGQHPPRPSVFGSPQWNPQAAARAAEQHRQSLDMASGPRSRSYHPSMPNTTATTGSGSSGGSSGGGSTYYSFIGTGEAAPRSALAGSARTTAGKVGGGYTPGAPAAQTSTAFLMESLNREAGRGGSLEVARGSMESERGRSGGGSMDSERGRERGRRGLGAKSMERLRGSTQKLKKMFPELHSTGILDEPPPPHNRR
ncbi:hypothetical protein HDU96_007290 [Phlyctochytrium bullatum]|nr:hypothetical protein HDU96_007290 [Phlyctochytrium bullatum]